MCRKCPKNPPLDTLVGLDTAHHNPIDNEQDIKLENCTKATDRQVLVNRAKRKYLSEALSVGLVKITEIKHEKILKKVKKSGWTDQNLQDFNQNVQARKSYWNMFHCAAKLEKVEGRVTTRYCKNRTCMVCNSIRTAQNINTYGSVLEAWKEEMFMVTLTVPNCEEKLLKSTIDKMHSIFVNAKNALRKRHQRGTGVKIEGLRKFECTYNPIRDDYHPHFHVLVRGEEAAQELLEQWLKGTKRLGTKRIAQDIRQANKNAAIELFKYFTKVVTSTPKEGAERTIYLDALDHIFKAVRGRRTFQNFGFVIADYKEEEEIKEIEEEEPKEELDEAPEVFRWNQEQADWISTSTGELLAEHKLSEVLKDITKKMSFKMGKEGGKLHSYLDRGGG